MKKYTKKYISSRDIQSQKTYRVYYSDGNQRMYGAHDIVELVTHLARIDNDYTLTIYKIEEV